MCGIAGFFSLSPRPEEKQNLEAMADAIAHRGPDSHGLWENAAQGIYFGHRRLSTLELSPLGHQPMHSANGRWAILYNGEVYNHLALRADLEKRGVRLRGRSDTEILLETLALDGFAQTLPRVNGMFAFAAWDKQECRLYLARDRFGEKPLYYGWNGDRFFFASELKALRAHPLFEEELCEHAVDLFLRLSYIPAPWSIAKNIFKLPPGQWLELQTRQGRLEPSTQVYWSLEQSIERAFARRESLSYDDKLSQLHAALQESVRLRAQADVPVGAFLSGGIDSSMVVALAAQISSGPVKTFSIGFEEAGFNEAPLAKKVAQHLGTDHTELYVSARQAQETIPQLPYWYDEPFADASQIPTLLVSQLARKTVTVSLSGDGGDELFAGYNRHLWADRIENMQRRIPRFVRSLGARALLTPPTGFWDAFAVGPFGVAALGQKVARLADALDQDDCTSAYARLVSQWKQDEAVTRTRPRNLFDLGHRVPQSLRLSEKFMFLDTLTYLTDDILAKVDRATMSVSLEGRVPFLDPHVVESAWTFCVEEKMSGNQGKRPLRQLLAQYIPPVLFDRPKAGFVVPIGTWLRGPLQAWAESLLTTQSLEEMGVLNPKLIRSRWAQHLSGRSDQTSRIWNVLMLQAWRKSLG